ncbi:MAG: hypothetical protein K2N94_01305 [Lachnospiraceae bacterium]|nr:hypothetical protein [Lachnospiraceae bacterium]
MNKYSFMHCSSVVLVILGVLLAAAGIFWKDYLFWFGASALAIGLFLLGRWISRAYTYICPACYLRIDVGVREALFAPLAGGDRRRLYCPKCRRKKACKAKRISLRMHVY